MKTKLTLVLALITLLYLSAFSQAPNSFKYQSIIRKTDGSVLTNQTVKVKISIIKGSTSGPTAYSEVNSTTTNAYGIINLNIGDGSEKSGAISTIDWSASNYYIKIEIDETGGTNYSLSSISQLLSVPFALYANSVNSIDWSKILNKPTLFSGNYSDLINKPNNIARKTYVDSLISDIKSNTPPKVDFGWRKPMVSPSAPLRPCLSTS